MTQPFHEVTGITVVIPAFNEEAALGQTLSQLKKALADIGQTYEILVVDDGSTDGTAGIAKSAQVRVLSHPINSGYGHSLLTGIEAARYDTIAIVDADGTYPVERLPELLAFYRKGFHMAVAARQGSHYHSSISKSFLRIIFRFLAEFSCGRNIPDINSGFRIFDRRPVLAWRASLSTGFSFTTSITLLFMLNNLFVGYLPMAYSRRVGQSKVRLLRDSLRSLQIIFTIIAQFNPLKLYLLFCLVNVVGNTGLWILDSSVLLALGWNSASLIAAAGALGLIAVKPAGASFSSACARPDLPE